MDSYIPENPAGGAFAGTGPYATGSDADRRIILFRFHDQFDVCRERIRLLRHFNPDVPVYGLYGGLAEHWDDARRSVEDAVVHLHMWSAADPYWKWMHADLAVKEWFRAYGHAIPFDLLYEHEYDMLVCAPLHEVYPPLPANALAFSAVTVTESVAAQWSWTSREDLRPNYLAFLDYLAERYGVDSIDHIIQGPGPLLTRRFLTAFCQLEDCDLAHNEIAYPAFAQVLGFTLVDNLLHPPMKSEESKRWFGCDGGSINWKEIESELRCGTRRAFHPVKYPVTLEQVLDALRVDTGRTARDADQPQRAAGIDMVELAGGYMVRQAEPLRVHQLDNTASAILELCDGQTTVAEIAEGIAGAFSLDAPPLAEVAACVAELRRAGVLADRAEPAAELGSGSACRLPRLRRLGQRVRTWLRADPQNVDDVGRGLSQMIHQVDPSDISTRIIQPSGRYRRLWPRTFPGRRAAAPVRSWSANAPLTH